MLRYNEFTELIFLINGEVFLIKGSLLWKAFRYFYNRKLSWGRTTVSRFAPVEILLYEQATNAPTPLSGVNFIEL